ncbi:tetraacyldisaccharide 4'-kinase [Arundinibacter roseus]|uniref:tetraacyldisaccharide 4'-kinase n=1 Tax=Arundinibacter roseus TaxID=2070510 RepID=UPI001E47C233|nr:tetraacyldisaccharide 4'-kinase [Arundinibacter roseus]
MKKNRLFGLKFIKQSLIKLAWKPLTWLYSLVTSVRNLLYDTGLLRSFTAKQFTVVVGNLTVGGTGKTPMIEYLIRSFAREFQLVTLSRGYGRETRGFRQASSQSTAREVGDEPLQYYEKFGKNCHVAVCEDRVKGAQILAQQWPKHNLLLLDDAFQHRRLKADLYLLLNDFNRPFYEDEPFPGGRLRESRQGAGRADAVICTKCPADLSPGKRIEIETAVGRYIRSGTPCFFSSIRYASIRRFDEHIVQPGGLFVLTGIAQPEPLLHYLQENYLVNGIKLFPDHHLFTESDVLTVLKSVKNEELIVTTEKDLVKLRPLTQNLNLMHRFGYIAMEVDFGSDTGRFQEWLTLHVRTPMLTRS